MSSGFRSELRKAFHEIGLDLLGSAPADGWRTMLLNATLMILGAVAAHAAGRLILGDHWTVYWVFPIFGAWLFEAAFHRIAGTGRSRA